MGITRNEFYVKVGEFPIETLSGNTLYINQQYCSIMYIMVQYKTWGYADEDSP